MTPLSRRAGRAAVLSWCLFDWAGSAFNTIIVTFVFATYFVRAVAPDPVAGTAAWAAAQTAAGLTIALAAAPLGAVADRGGSGRALLGVCTALLVACTAALWFVRPHAADAPLALALVAGATVAFEIAFVFYNAMLPDIAGPTQTRSDFRSWLGDGLCGRDRLPRPLPGAADRSAAAVVRTERCTGGTGSRHGTVRSRLDRSFRLAAAGPRPCAGAARSLADGAAPGVARARGEPPRCGGGSGPAAVPAGADALHGRAEYLVCLRRYLRRRHLRDGRAPGTTAGHRAQCHSRDRRGRIRACTGPDRRSGDGYWWRWEGWQDSARSSCWRTRLRCSGCWRWGWGCSWGRRSRRAAA